jgi:hypothetical protein
MQHWSAPRPRDATLVLLASAALLVGCGASESPPRTSPVDDRAEPATFAGAPPAVGASATELGAPGPPSATQPEGATARAIEFLAAQLGIPSREIDTLVAQPHTWPDECLGVPAVVTDGCAPGLAVGFKVVLVDAFRGTHVVHVASDAAVWAGEVRVSGVVLGTDEQSHSLVVDTGGQTQVLRAAMPGSVRFTAPLPPIGAQVLLAHDATPTGDGSRVVAWLLVTSSSPSP